MTPPSPDNRQQTGATPPPVDPAEQAAADVQFGEIPDEVPGEVLDAVAAAATVADRLAAIGRQVHVDVDEQGQMTIQLQDLDGNVLGRLSPSQLLDIAGTGGPLDD